jgi:hypothetical protein
VARLAEHLATLRMVCTELSMPTADVFDYVHYLFTHQVSQAPIGGSMPVARYQGSVRSAVAGLIPPTRGACDTAGSSGDDVEVTGETTPEQRNDYGFDPDRNKSLIVLD